ncbi:hypothetical protein BESB_010250 [Besnoitia besnoiti]|uniref:Uncharacterized protein n=1 Tax=Besnoitia besnoiti TaxID=94643 RepID=A0A2A9MQQ9_BESBE|nr:hypothetical protein BESB_010250 [Besnoitia besnoiti]PFH38683.1 hypothetical protein BESB_010250 [Besnoitia besnoiti]
MQSGSSGACLSFSSTASGLLAPDALPVPVSLTSRKRGSGGVRASHVKSERDREADGCGWSAAAEENAFTTSAPSWSGNPYNLVALEKPEECLSIGEAFTDTCLTFALDGRLTPEQVLYLEQCFKKAMVTDLKDCVRASGTTVPASLRRAPPSQKKQFPKAPGASSRVWTLKGTCVSFKRESDASRMILEDASLNIKGLFLPCKRLCLVDVSRRQAKKRKLF